MRGPALHIFRNDSSHIQGASFLIQSAGTGSSSVKVIARPWDAAAYQLIGTAEQRQVPRIHMESDDPICNDCCVAF
jgi:hypothetical protein